MVTERSADANGQPIEVYNVTPPASGGNTVTLTAYEHYVYSPNGQLVLRDRSSGDDGTMEQRLYALQDPNGSVLALANTSGQVVERFAYDSLGNAQALDANGNAYSATINFTGTDNAGLIDQYFSGSVFGNGSGSPTADGSQYAWNILYQGDLFNAVAATYNTPNGVFNPGQDSMLAPNPGMQMAGLSGYGPPSILSYLGSAIASTWGSVCESTPLYGAGQVLTDIDNGISGFSSWANNEINSAPTWLQPALTPYQVELGAFNSVGNMIGGMGSLLENPVGTVANLVLHPVGAAEAAWGGVTGTFSNLFSGNPYQMGQAVGNIAMAVAPSAGEFGDVSRVGEVIPEALAKELQGGGSWLMTVQQFDEFARGEEVKRGRDEY